MEVEEKVEVSMFVRLLQLELRVCEAAEDYETCCIIRDSSAELGRCALGYEPSPELLFNCHLYFGTLVDVRTDGYRYLVEYRTENISHTFEVEQDIYDEMFEVLSRQKQKVRPRR